MSQGNTVKRALLESEKRKMRWKHLVIIPVLLIASAVLWVVLKIDTLPEPARWAGGGIALLATVVFVVKLIKMELDLRSGIVHVVSGNITRKYKFGGNRKGTSSGISPSSSSGRRSSATYYIYIDGQKFNVPAKIYSSVHEGNQVEMSYFPKSQYYLNIEVVKKGD